MINLVSAAIGLTGAIASNISNSKSRSKQNNILNKKLDELDSWYKQSRSEDLVDSSQMKKIVREQQEQQNIQNKEMANSISKGNLTPEKEIALASTNNINWANNISEISAKDSARREQVENIYKLKADEIYENIYSIN